MHSYSALYYPFIHFKSDRWLKLSALYWDDMSRIVPSRYQPEDTQTVKDLGDFVKTVRPDWVRAGIRRELRPVRGGVRFSTRASLWSRTCRHLDCGPRVRTAPTCGRSVGDRSASR